MPDRSSEPWQASYHEQHRDEPAFEATEFAVCLVAVVGVLIASWLVGDSDGRGDVVLADKAWFHVTLLTVGYLVSSGLAQAGSRAPRDA